MSPTPPSSSATSETNVSGAPLPAPPVPMSPRGTGMVSETLYVPLKSSVPASPVPMVDLDRSHLVGDVMSRTLITTGPDARLSAVAFLLRFHSISGVPVVHGTTLVGVLSEKDILRALAQHGGLQVASEMIDHVIESPSDQREVRRERWKGVLDRMRVKDVMTAQAVSTTMDASLDAALRRMLAYHVQRLPVVDGPHLVGIITRGDVMMSIEADR
jgi:CBS domain-containing protein